MRVQILDSAKRHLLDGYWFYEKQATGLGVYFLDSLIADIDSLALYGGIHSRHFGFYRLQKKYYQSQRSQTGALRR